MRFAWIACFAVGCAHHASTAPPAATPPPSMPPIQSLADEARRLVAEQMGPGAPDVEALIVAGDVERLRGRMTPALRARKSAKETARLLALMRGAKATEPSRPVERVKVCGTGRGDCPDTRFNLGYRSLVISDKTVLVVMQVDADGAIADMDTRIGNCVPHTGCSWAYWVTD